MINFIYRNFLCNLLSHETKVKIARWFYRFPVFRQILENQYDFHPNEIKTEITFEEQKKKYNAYLSDCGWGKNDLERIFLDEPHRLVSKHIRYLRVYEQFFSKYRGRKDITIVEVGVFGGGLYSFGRGILERMQELLVWILIRVVKNMRKNRLKFL